MKQINSGVFEQALHDIMIAHRGPLKEMETGRRTEIDLNRVIENIFLQSHAKSPTELETC